MDIRHLVPFCKPHQPSTIQGPVAQSALHLKEVSAFDKSASQNQCPGTAVHAVHCSTIEVECPFVSARYVQLKDLADLFASCNLKRAGTDAPNRLSQYLWLQKIAGSYRLLCLRLWMSLSPSLEAVSGQPGCSLIA